MLSERELKEVLDKLDIPPRMQKRFEDIATMCGILPDELLTRMIVRLYNDAEKTVRNLVDSDYDWKGDR